jgi:hypothetical protein
MCIVKGTFAAVVATGLMLLAAGVPVVADAAQSKPEDPKDKPDSVETDAKTGRETTDPRYGDLPLVIRDASSDDWLVDRVAGNCTAGPEFFQGPAREVSMPRPWTFRLQADGSICLGFLHSMIDPPPAQVKTNGTLVAIRPYRLGSYVAKEKAWYSVDRCAIWRTVENKDGIGQTECIAGNPGQPKASGQRGRKDGKGKEAYIAADIRGQQVTTNGTLYWLEGNGDVRKLENGEVTTLKLKSQSSPVQFTMGMHDRMKPGESEDVAYVPQGGVICRVDMKKSEAVVVAGIPKPKYGTPMGERFQRNGDGPALTHFTANSGMVSAVYDGFHKTLWVGGADERDLRFLKDGWVKSIACGTELVGGGINMPFDGVGISPKKLNLIHNKIIGADNKGGVYFVLQKEYASGIWRVYNRKEVAP